MLSDPREIKLKGKTIKMSKQFIGYTHTYTHTREIEVLWTKRQTYSNLWNVTQPLIRGKILRLND